MRSFGAIWISGPKFCGKTRTAVEHSSSVFALDDAQNDYRNYRIASMDPSVALEGSEPHLIDEWQLVPPIWDMVRRSIDDDNRPGRFILSGSSTPLSEKKQEKRPPLHSGFGRITTIKMRTMSLYESSESDGRVSLKGLFDGDVKTSMTERKSLESIVDLILCGGWPGNLGRPADDRINAVSKYPEDICEVDLPRIDSSKSPSRMRRVMRSLARNESTLASMASLSRDIKEFDDDTFKDTTVSEYVDVLDRMGLVSDQPAFNPNLRSSVRVGKTPKRHLTDPALAAACMRLTRESLMEDLNTLGFLFESLCERDLQIYAHANGGDLYHYRDSAGREIDAVVDIQGRGWGAFEIKLGANQIDKAAENLLKISNMISNDPKGKPPMFLCVISGLESACYRREDGVYVVPITSLRA